MIIPQATSVSRLVARFWLLFLRSISPVCRFIRLFSSFTHSFLGAATLSFIFPARGANFPSFRFWVALSRNLFLLYCRFLLWHSRDEIAHGSTYDDVDGSIDFDSNGDFLIICSMHDYQFERLEDQGSGEWQKIYWFLRGSFDMIAIAIVWCMDQVSFCITSFILKFNFYLKLNSFQASHIF